MTAFHAWYPDPLPPDGAIAHFMTEHGFSLSRDGFRIESQTPTAVTFTRRRTSVAALVIGLLTFPAGILFWLFWKEEQRFTIAAAAADYGARVDVHGMAPKQIGQAFARIGERRQAELISQP